MVRADISVPPIFCDRTYKYAGSLRKLCEDAHCSPHFYNSSIKQYKDSQMCNNSGQLFVHMFVYCSSRSTVHVCNTSEERTTSACFW